MPEYFAKALGDASKPLKVGVDASLLPVATHGELQRVLEAAGHSLVALQTRNPLDAAWESRPALPSGACVMHPGSYAGQSIEDKLAKLRADMQA